MEFAIYFSPKWSDCHETKSQHTDWTLRLKCDHRVWPWPWPWPWIFKVQYRIGYISAKNGPIAVKRKANISIELQASNVTNGFDLDHDLDLWPHTWPWPWIFMVKFWYSCILEWEGRLTLHKGGGSRSFMTMTMTFWWPRSGVWIYQIVTGVTSVVGVPSTHLVITCSTWDYSAETGHFPATHIIELFETPDASRVIVMPIKLYGHSKSSGAASLCWLGCSCGKHGNCRGHSAVKWSVRWEPASQILQFSEHAPFHLYSETH